MKKLLLTFIMAVCAVCANAITIDDICGLYVRHMDNRKPMGAQIADIKITISALDATHVVLSGMLKETMPIMGEVDLDKSTITFTKQVVARMGEGEEAVDSLLANCWGETADDEPVVAVINEDGTIVMGDEDAAYAGFCFKLPVLPAPMFNMYGIITLTPDKSTKWSADANYTLGEGNYVKGTSKLSCKDASVAGYDYSLDLKTYWGKYEMRLKKNDDGTYSICNNDDEVPSFNNEAFFWWINWYEYPEWSEWTRLYTVDAEGNNVFSIEGSEKGGKITLKGEYVLYGADSKEALDAMTEPTIYEGEQTFTIEWGDGGTSISSPTAVNKATSNAIYNIAGQRVANAKKGLYIVGNKKILVK